MSHISIDITKNTATTNISQHLIHNPFFIPCAEAYYWTAEWRQWVKESMEDLEAGNYTDYGPDDEFPGRVE